MDLVSAGVGIIIPALNEEASLPRVLSALPPVREVVVVDNGSTDGTAAAARAHGARVVSEPVRGYGVACLTGLRALHPDVRIVAFLDGDFADDPTQLPELIRPIQEDAADLVVGSRISNGRNPGAMEPHARFGNWLASTLMRRWYGLQVTDVGPFRAASRVRLLGLDMQPSGYRWTTEMMVKAARSGWRVLEIPVRYRRRIGKSKVSGTIVGSIKAAWYILATVYQYRNWRPPYSPAQQDATAGRAGETLA